MSLENLGQLSLEEVLKEIATQYGDKAAFSTSLSWEDQIISHHIFF
jgi:hypothetical protein